MSEPEVPKKSALSDLIDERKYQEERWSTDHDKGHTREDWLCLLTVYLGKAALECEPYEHVATNNHAFKRRVQQLGAVCLAALEALE